ncbi:hypothetical protein ACIBBD_17015 [Streptomyces sp. NPDC051315]
MTAMATATVLAALSCVASLPVVRHEPRARGVAAESDPGSA